MNPELAGRKALANRMKRPGRGHRFASGLHHLQVYAAGWRPDRIPTAYAALDGRTSAQIPGRTFTANTTPTIPVMPSSDPDPQSGEPEILDDDSLDGDTLATIASGRSAVGQVIALLLGVEVVVIGYYWIAVGMTKAPQQVGRFGIALLLAWALWRGYRWVRWVIAGLAVLGVWIAVPALLAILDGNGSMGHIFLTIMLFCYVVIARYLLWHPHVPSFLAAQRMARGAAI